MSQAESQGQPTYKTSSFSGGGSCVEVGQTAQGGLVIVRHSLRPNAASLKFSAHEWAAFVAGVKAGEFDF
ncbi:DUF397 domain-containing protein [Pseudonocardia xinjiangensis]|uniref:DUF397 domain-containing protein n=1 Tax=Pseudonocardia xinjiangensis TaxID=75289 RepID=UPI003D94129A